MMRFSVLQAFGLAAMCIAAFGCAQCQHSNAGLMAQCTSAMGDRSPAPHRVAKASRRPQPASRPAVPPPVADAVISSRPQARRGAVMQASVIDAAPSSDGCSDACGDLHDGSCTGQAATCQVCPLPACGACADCMGGRKCCLDVLFEPGPPPVRYVPPMPPKFLPVPTQPTLSPARPDAPDFRRGDVEIGYRSQMTFPGRD